MQTGLGLTSAQPKTYYVYSDLQEWKDLIAVIWDKISQTFVQHLKGLLHEVLLESAHSLTHSQRNTLHTPPQKQQSHSLCCECLKQKGNSSSPGKKKKRGKSILSLWERWRKGKSQTEDQRSFSTGTCCWVAVLHL